MNVKDFYEYNRLTDANYGRPGSSESSSRFDVIGLSYDAAGNILSLKRNNENGNLWNNLTYNYNSTSNRLQSVSDAAGSLDATFTYDANGNMISQSGKFADINYGHRNLPTFFSVLGDYDVHAYYDAGGRRILKEVQNGDYQFYVKDGPLTLAVIDQNGFSHFNLIGNGVFGRLEPSGARRYYLIDHLGSTRLVRNNSGTILSTFDYYPFGLLMPGRYSTSNNTIEKFTGKQLDESLGLYYFGMRYLDPALARWFVRDPFANKYPSLSPYNYAANNPLKFIDPNGGFVNPIYDEEGNFLGTDDRGLQGEAIVMNKSDFTQGMSHEVALDKGTLLSDLSNNFSSGTINKIRSHQSGLSSRPDWDGKLTFGEVTKWSNEGSGKPLFVDANKINLSSVDINDFKSKNSKFINLLGSDFNLESGPVYGHIKITLLDVETGKVRLGFDSTLLDIHDFANKFFKTVNDWLYPGTPKDFKIYCAPCNTQIDIQ